MILTKKSILPTMCQEVWEPLWGGCRECGEYYHGWMCDGMHILFVSKLRGTQTTHVQRDNYICNKLAYVSRNSHKTLCTHRSSCKPLHDHHSEDTESWSLIANTSVSTARCLQNGHLNLPRHFLHSANLLWRKFSQPDWRSIVVKILWFAQSGQVKIHMALWAQL